MYRSERQRRNMRNSLGLAPLRRVLNHSGGSHRRMSILVDLLKTRLMRKLCVTPPLMCLNRSLRQGMKLRVGYILTTAIIHCFGHCKCFLYAFHMGRRCETHAAYYLRRPCNDATLELIRGLCGSVSVSLDAHDADLLAYFYTVIFDLIDSASTDRGIHSVIGVSSGRRQNTKV
jgi:hypothetical protein